MTFINNIKSAYMADSEADRGTIVETLLLIAGFAIVTILAVNWIGTAVTNKAADVSACIEGSNTYNSQTSSTACQNGDANAKSHSYKNDSGYKGRYGG